MPAQLLDGNLLSKKLRAEIAARAAILTAKGVRPGLAVIVIGDNPASQVYVRNKVKACEDVGFHSVLERYPDRKSTRLNSVTCQSRMPSSA